MSDTVKVGVLSDEEGEPSWLAKNPAYADERYGAVEIPAETWRSFKEAEKAIASAVAEAVRLSPRDEDGRLKHPCADYSGYHRPGHVYWTVLLSTDATGKTWPTRDVELSPRMDDRVEAEKLLDEIVLLGGSFVICGYGPNYITRLDPDRLSLKRNEWAEHWHDCDTCGWDHDSHRFQQQTIDSPASIATPLTAEESNRDSNE